MKKIIFATTNNGKFLSAKRILKKYDISAVKADLELPESQNSIEFIASQKAKFAYNILRKPVIAMDAGFFIHSLSGFPMMYVKPVLQTIGVEGILKLVKDKNRECEFREVLSFSSKTNSKPKLFIRTVKGRLSEHIAGTMHKKHWSELALIFIPEGFTKTMADMDNIEFSKFLEKVEEGSHFELFAKYYSDL